MLYKLMIAVVLLLISPMNTLQGCCESQADHQEVAQQQANNKGNFPAGYLKEVYESPALSKEPAENTKAVVSGGGGILAVIRGLDEWVKKNLW